MKLWGNDSPRTLPDSIFNHTHDELLVVILRPLVAHYNQASPGLSRLKKQQLLRALHAIESAIDESERPFVIEWIQDALIAARAHNNLPPLARIQERLAASQEESSQKRRLSDDHEPQKKQKNDQDEDAIEKRLCIVCYEELPEDRFPNRTLTPTCQHGADVCLDCLGRHLAIQITEVAWDQVQCASCDKIVPCDAVQEFATAESFAEYDRKALMAAVNQDPNFQECLNPQCSSGQIHAPGNAEPYMRCNACGHKICFVHKRPWHQGQTCEEYDEQRHIPDDPEAASQSLIDESATRCPQCNVAVTKVEGCDHMTCKLCRTEFCYECGVDYDRVHRYGMSAHAHHCSHYSASDQLAVLDAAAEESERVARQNDRLLRQQEQYAAQEQEPVERSRLPDARSSRNIDVQPRNAQEQREAGEDTFQGVEDPTRPFMPSAGGYVPAIHGRRGLDPRRDLFPRNTSGRTPRVARFLRQEVFIRRNPDAADARLAEAGIRSQSPQTQDTQNPSQAGYNFNDNGREPVIERQIPMAPSSHTNDATGGNRFEPSQASPEHGDAASNQEQHPQSTNADRLPIAHTTAQEFFRQHAQLSRVHPSRLTTSAVTASDGSTTNAPQQVTNLEDSDDDLFDDSESTSEGDEVFLQGFRRQ